MNKFLIKYLVGLYIIIFIPSLALAQEEFTLPKKIWVNDSPLVDGMQIQNIVLNVNPKSGSITISSNERIIELTVDSTTGSITIRPSSLKIFLNKKFVNSPDINLNSNITQINMKLEDDLKKVIMKIDTVYKIVVEPIDIISLGLSFLWKLYNKTYSLIFKKVIIEIWSE